jgi:hypothetical protein
MPMDRLANAIAIAAAGHNGQSSKDSYPYIFHPLTAMFRLRREGESAMIVAVLHDFFEDCEHQHVDLSFLLPEERYALECLTKKKGENYLEVYLPRVMTSRLAMLAKHEDLIHNLDGSRMPLRPLTDMDMRRWDKYRIALDRIRTALGRLPEFAS